MDILNADLGLQNEYDKWTKRRRIQETSRNPAAKPKKAKNTKSKAQEKLPPKKKQEVDESAHHFIAYVPVNGSVWKLDGLRRQPVNIGMHFFHSYDMFSNLFFLRTLRRRLDDRC